MTTLVKTNSTKSDRYYERYSYILKVIPHSINNRVINIYGNGQTSYYNN
jgi:hypothetical protein